MSRTTSVRHLSVGAVPDTWTASPSQVRLEARGACSASGTRAEAAIEAYRRGDFVIVVDDDDRENEGDLIIAADAVDARKMAFMIRHTSGVVCAAMPNHRADALGLPHMVEDNTDSMRTAFTVTVDYRLGTTTGISAADRAATMRALADAATTPDELNRPGHVFPLRARDGGILVRPGHTEAAVDLGRLAGRAEVGVLCEITNDDGTMARYDDLQVFAKRHGIPMVEIADLIQHRVRHEPLVERVASAPIPTRHGTLETIAYRSQLDQEEHVVFVVGQPSEQANALVRVHSECLTGDIFGSLRCDCGGQLETALEMIAAEGHGVIVYLRGHEGRGIGLSAKLQAYALQDQGFDTVDANTMQGLPVDKRDYAVGAQILKDLGLDDVRLMTNNPAKLEALERFGIRTTETVPLRVNPTEHNARYLATKRERMGHFLAGGA